MVRDSILQVMRGGADSYAATQVPCVQHRILSGGGAAAVFPMTAPARGCGPAESAVLVRCCCRGSLLFVYLITFALTAIPSLTRLCLNSELITPFSCIRWLTWIVGSCAAGSRARAAPVLSVDCGVGRRGTGERGDQRESRRSMGRGRDDGCGGCSLIATCAGDAWRDE